MNRFAVIFSLVLSLVFSSCTNIKDSTRESAIDVVRHTEFFQEIIQYWSVGSGSSIMGPSYPPGDPYTFDTQPTIATMDNKTVVHIVLFLSKPRINWHPYCLAFLNDEPTPKIVHTLCFGDKETSIPPTTMADPNYVPRPPGFDYPKDSNGLTRIQERGLNDYEGGSR